MLFRSNDTATTEIYTLSLHDALPILRRGASLGANSTIVCGHTIGRYAFIGAGAVVTRDVPDYALVVGNPARIAGWMCDCGVKLSAGSSVPAAATCLSCGAAYTGHDGVLVRSA